MTATAATARYMTPAEAARALGVSLDYLYKLLWAGRLQGRKVGRRWQVSAAAVAARVAADDASP